MLQLAFLRIVIGQQFDQLFFIEPEFGLFLGNIHLQQYVDHATVLLALAGNFL